jgi:Bacterial protein of unknown function (DUF899)
MNLPEVVSENEWQRAHEKLLAKEKAYLREGDKLAAERRREPMHEIAKGYRFDGPDGEVSLLDLFEGRASSGSITYVRAQPRRRVATAARCSSIRWATPRTCAPETGRLRLGRRLTGVERSSQFRLKSGDRPAARGGPRRR